MTKLALCLGAALLFACSPSGSDDVEDPIDAAIDSSNPPIDAPPNPIDGPPATPGIGTACTGEGQGSCPTGFDCLTLQGGSGSWCSKRCTGTSDQSCAVGYTGPGHAACLLAVTPAGGGTPQNYCTIVCFDAPGAPTYCPGGDSQCNNTCPTPLTCTAEIAAQGGPVQARLCE